MRNLISVGHAVTVVSVFNGSVLVQRLVPRQYFIAIVDTVVIRIGIYRIGVMVVDFLTIGQSVIIRIRVVRIRMRYISLKGVGQAIAVAVDIDIAGRFEIIGLALARLKSIETDDRLHPNFVFAAGIGRVVKRHQLNRDTAAFPDSQLVGVAEIGRDDAALHPNFSFGRSSVERIFFPDGSVT